jgi:hypothetical protein
MILTSQSRLGIPAIPILGQLPATDFRFPLDIPVDELVTWKQLTGDRRLSDALAECDASGWDALPLPPRELSRLLPTLLGTAKAAERWLAKNPPEAHR